MHDMLWLCEAFSADATPPPLQRMREDILLEMLKVSSGCGRPSETGKRSAIDVLEFCVHSLDPLPWVQYLMLYVHIIGSRNISSQACLPCYKKVIEQSQSSAQNQLQDTPDRETRKGSISENLAATRGSNPRASVEGAAKDDIYGRLDFAGGDSGGFLTACDGDSAEQKLSTLESSFDATAEGSADILSPWIHAILFIRTDDSMSPVLEASVPRGRVRPTRVQIK